MEEYDFSRHAQLILDGVWLGSEDAGAAPVELLQRHGITRVLIPAHTGREAVLWPSQLTYLQYNVPDVADFPLLPLLEELCTFVDEAVEAGEGVLVHCAQGKSRSAAVVIAWVMHRKRCSYADAHHLVRSKRPVISTKV